MISSATRSAFARCAEGSISFSRFARETREFWEAAARYLQRRWKASDAVETSDLVQELLTEAWKSFPMHDPARGDLADFVSYQALSRAKRWLHGQRGRRKCSRSDKAVSRHPLRFCEISRGDDEDIAGFLEERLGSMEPEQDRRHEFEEKVEETVRVVEEILSRHDRGHRAFEDQPILKAYVEADGNIVRALEILYGDVAVRPLDMENTLLKVVARAIQRRNDERNLADTVAEPAPASSVGKLDEDLWNQLMETAK